MRLEIDNSIVDAAMDSYTGPETTGKGIVVWLLKGFAEGKISELRELHKAPMGN